MSTVQKKVNRLRYPSDMSKSGWQKFKKAFDIPVSDDPKGGLPPAGLREVINSL